MLEVLIMLYAICNTSKLLNLTEYGEYEVFKIKNRKRKIVVKNNENKFKAYSRKHFYPIKE